MQKCRIRRSPVRVAVLSQRIIFCRLVSKFVVSDSQFDKCDDCRRREADRLKKGLMVAGGVALSFLTVAAKLIGGSSKNKN